MATKWDVFSWLYEQSGPRKIIGIVKGLNQKRSEYDKIRKILDVLVQSKLVTKTKHGFERVMNDKNQHFFTLLKYCMKNGVNYNEVCNETVAGYVSKAFLKKSFTAKDIRLHPRTFGRVSHILEKHGFLIVLSRKPFNAIIPYNSFLGDLVTFYGHRPLVARQKRDEYFGEIKKELAKFSKLKARNLRAYRGSLEAFQIKFVHHSLSIEGNPLTLVQTARLLRDKIVSENLALEAVQEVQNYQKAFLQTLQNVRDEVPLTKESMLNYHFTALQHKSKWAGKIRDDPVTIKGNKHFKLAKPKEIERLLDSLIKDYNDFVKTKHALKEIIDFAAYLHNEFQYIHPFFDGNSRTTRLITFHFLQMNGIPVFDIPLGMLEQYVSATKGAKKRDEQQLAQELQQIILYNLKTINKKLSQ
jgi:fido (protein-threonine AMPylation protein)